jgi:hypothetical protein
VTLVRPVDKAGQTGGYSSRTTSVPESLSDFSMPVRPVATAAAQQVFHGFEWVSPWISLRDTWMDVSCIFVIDLVPLNARKPLQFKVFRSEL